MAAIFLLPRRINMIGINKESAYECIDKYVLIYKKLERIVMELSNSDKSNDFEIRFILEKIEEEMGKIGKIAIYTEQLCNIKEQCENDIYRKLHLENKDYNGLIIRRDINDIKSIVSVFDDGWEDESYDK